MPPGSPQTHVSIIGNRNVFTTHTHICMGASWTVKAFGIKVVVHTGGTPALLRFLAQSAQGLRRGVIETGAKERDRGAGIYNY